jgi:hypothetical protein
VAKDESEAVKMVKEGVAAQMALEALDALIAKLADVKQMMTSGQAFSAEDLEKKFEGWWCLRDAITTYGTIAAQAPASAAAPVVDAAKAPEAPPAAPPAAAPPVVETPAVTPPPVVEDDPAVAKGEGGTKDLAGPRKAPADLFRMAKNKTRTSPVVKA